MIYNSVLLCGILMRFWRALFMCRFWKVPVVCELTGDVLRIGSTAYEQRARQIISQV